MVIRVFHTRRARTGPRQPIEISTLWLRFSSACAEPRVPPGEPLSANGLVAEFRWCMAMRTGAAFAAAFVALIASADREARASAGCDAVNAVGPVAPLSSGVSAFGIFAPGDTVSFTIPGGIGFGDMLDDARLYLPVRMRPPFTVTFTYPAPQAPINDRWIFDNFSTGTGTATCTSLGSGSTDSQNLHSLEIAATQTVATISGQVISGAVENAIDDAFNNSVAPFTPGPNGLFLNFAAEPQRDAATQEVLDALAYAGTGGMVYKTPPPAPSIASDWSAWADVRGTGFDQSSASTHEEQINVTGGLSRKLSPDLLVGLFTGYENFSFTMRIDCRQDDRRRRHHRRLRSDARSPSIGAPTPCSAGPTCSTTALPAPPRARSPARVGSVPAALPAPIAGLVLSTNPRRASTRCGSAMTPLPTRSARHSRRTISRQAG